VQNGMPLQGAGAAGRAPADDRPTLLCASSFGADGMLRLRGRRLAARSAAPLPSLFWAAGLSFSRAELFLQARSHALFGSLLSARQRDEHMAVTM